MILYYRCIINFKKYELENNNRDYFLSDYPEIVEFHK